MPNQTINIGSRRSRLARLQAHIVARKICDVTGDTSDRFTFRHITTKGDLLKNQPLAQFGGKGLFTKELDQAVINDQIDIAVHSLKDLPCQPLPDELKIAACLPRQDARDALIAPVRHIEDLPPDARLGGASVRRSAQARAIRPDLQPVLIRGNLPTRLGHLNNNKADAMILAACGLRRLGLLDPNWSLLPVESFPPAPGQGILAAVTRNNAKPWLDQILTSIDDTNTHLAAETERSFSLHLGGSCNVPLAAYCHTTKSGHTTLIGEMLSHDGQQRYREQWHGPTPNKAADAREIGRLLAMRVRERMNNKSS